MKENQQKAPGLFITAKEAGKLIGYAPDYIARLCREGKLEGKFVSGGWMVSYPHVLAYAESISQKKLAQAERLSAELKSVAAPSVSGAKLASSDSVSPITIVAPRALHTPATRAQVPTQFPSLAAPLQRATAVALSLVLVFGTYALVDQRAFASARDAVGETLARAIWPSEMAMYTPDSFAAAAAAPSIPERIRNFFGWGDRASIFVSVVPYTPPLRNSIPVPSAPVASVPRVVAAPVRETMRERVVERVQYTPVFVSGGVSVADMALGLNQLDNKLSSRIALLSASLPGNTVVTPVTLAQATRIDQLNNTQITNPTITGGTITGSTISGLSFASISGTLGVSGGGTGTSTAPQFGELLVGNGAGGYQLLATSSLGIVGTGSGVPGGLAGQIQYNAGAGNFGGESGFAYDAAADRLSVVNASTTQISSAYASSTQGFFGTLSVGALSGVVRASGGAIATGTVNLANEVSGTLGISSGGTGTSSAPAYGQLLVGNTLGGYDFVSTSSLGLISSVSWGSITGTLSSQTDLQNALNAKLSLSDWYSTTTSDIQEGTNLYFTNDRVAAVIAGTTTTALAEGTNLYYTTARATTSFIGNLAGTTSVASITTLPNLSLPSSQVTGLFAYLFPNSATTTAIAFNGGLTATNATTTNATTTNLAITNLSNVLLSTTANGSVVATTSIGSNLINTTGNWNGTFDGQEGSYYLNAANLTNFGTPFFSFFSATTTDALAEGSLNKYYNNTLVNTYIAASTTIPKTYTNNTFAGTQTFTNTITGSISGNANTATTLQTPRTINGVSFDGSTNITITAASSTLLANNNTFSGTNSFTGNTTLAQATTSNLAISNVASTLLKTNADGTVVAATPGTDYATPASLNNYLLLTDWYSTTTSDIQEGTNLYFTTARATTSFVSNLAATTSVNSITTLSNLSITNAQVSDFASGINAYIHASTTIPKVYTANVFSALQTFGNSSTTLASFSYASSTLARIGTLALPNITSSLLKTDGSGNVVVAVAGTDYLTPTNLAAAYPFPLANNATSTLTQFNGGLTAFASSTIGNGTQTGGLTISGGATTTGNAYINGSLTLGTALSETNGGTGQSTYTVGDILYASSVNTLSKLSIGGSGTVLKVQGGIPQWGTDLTSGGGGGAGAWATTTDSLAIYPTDTSDVVIVGSNSTSTTNSIFEVAGKSYFSNWVGIGTTSAGSLFSIAGVGNFVPTGSTLYSPLTLGTLTATSSVNINGNTTLANATATNTFAKNINANTASFGATATSSFASNGALSLSQALAPTSGGTGLSTVASSSLLIGGTGNTWLQVATSSLGLPTFADVSSSLSAYLLLTDWYSTTTSDLQEGTNLYFTTARATTSFVSNLAATTSVNSITTLSNLSITNAQVSDFASGINAYIHASTTIPKVYTANVFSALQTFGNSSTTLASFSYASSTLARIGTLALPNITSSLLKTDGSGNVVVAVAGTDYLTPTNLAAAYPFPLANNATSTLTQFNGGLTAFASSTIGNGTQTGGLTISGGATTTGNAYFAGNLGIGTQAPSKLIDILNATNPTVRITDSTNSVITEFRSEDTQGFLGTVSNHDLRLLSNGTSRMTITAAGRFGIGTTTPAGKFDIFASNGDTNTKLFTISSSTASATSTLFSVSNTGSTTLFQIPSSVLKTDSNGVIVAATPGTDYATPASLNNYLLLTDWYSTTTSDIQEGTNLYFTTARATTSFVSNLAATTSVNSITTLSNLSITNAQVSDFASGINAYIHASTTIPKVYTANVFSALQTFGNSSTTLASFSYASSTNLFAGSATTSSLSLTGIAGGSLLKTGAGGYILPAIAGTDYANFAYPFTSGINFGVSTNSTTTALWFQNGLTASSTAYLSDINAIGIFNFASTSANASSSIVTLSGIPFITASSSAANTSLGLGALSMVTSGRSNTAVGYQSLLYATSSLDNTAVGDSALKGAASDSSGRNNTALGTHALSGNGAGNYNTGIGSYALSANWSGSDNVALGHNALTINSSGNGNVVFGSQAGANLEGANNTFVGFYAGYNLSSGYGNILVGSAEDSSLAQGLISGSGNIGIGNRIIFPSQTANNQLNIGGLIFGSLPATSTSLITNPAGYVSVGTTTASLGRLVIASPTDSQVALSAGAGIAQWAFRNAGGNFYLSTTTVAGTATTSTSALSVSGSGFGTTTLSGLSINGQATSTSNVGINITGGCFASNGACLSLSTIGGTVAIASGGTGTTTAPQGQLLYGGALSYQSVATTSLITNGSLAYSGTFGALVGGVAGTLSLNLSNANTWSALQTFNYSSSTLYSSFATASSTNLFAGLATLTQATTSNLALTGVASTLLKTNAQGSVIPATPGTDYATPASLNNYLLLTDWYSTTTSDIQEGTNLYFTTARATTSFVSNLAATTSVNSITTLSNLSITNAQVSDFASGINAYIHASTTIPKVYTANVFSALQTFGNSSTTLASFSYASSTNLFAGSATTSSLSLTGIAGGSLLKTGAGGYILPAIAGTDYANFAYPFTSGINYNTATAATTSALFASGGLFASSTVVFGSAGNPAFYFDASAGKLGLGTNPDTIFTVQIPNSSSDLSSFKKLQTGTGGARQIFYGGAAGNTLRGYFGFTRSSAGGDTFWGSGELDNAMALSSAGPIQLGTSNTLALTIDNSQNVGIGTNSPGGFRLNVNGTLNAGNTTLGTLSASFASTTQISSAGNAYFATSGGSVGIGTTSPFATLQIATTTGKNLVLSDSGAGANLKHWLFSSQGGNLYIGTTTDLYASSFPGLTIANNGNVGIGTTTTANAKLTTFGNFFLSGNNNYLNFGTTIGATGYGFRDNGGTMEFANVNGGWNQFTMATTGPSFSVHRNGTNQTVTGNTDTLLDWTTVVFDTNNNFNLTADRFTPTVPGLYIFNLDVRCNSTTAVCTGYIYKNGAMEGRGFGRIGITADVLTHGSVIVQMNGTTDYVEAYANNNSGTVIGGAPSDTHFSGTMIAPVNGNNAAGWANDGTQSFLLDNADKVGVGTSTPWAKLAVQGDSGQQNPVFEVASSSNASKFLSVAGDGFGTTTLSGLAITGQATSTSNVGINITGGCFAINGVCLSSGGGSWATLGFPFTSGSVWGTNTNSTTTNLALLGGLFASSTIRFGNSGVLSQFTFDSSRGALGLGTSTPFFQLSVASSTGPQLALSDTTATSPAWTFRSVGGNLYLATTSPSTFATTTISLFSLMNTGSVGIGTSTPTTSTKLDIYGDTILSGSNRYLNFGTTTGSTGYGFRDNGGTMEFANVNGGWNQFTMATTGPSFRVHRNGSATTTVAGASVVMDWTTEAFDTNNNFNLTNDTFQPTVPGKYIFTAGIYCSDSVSYCEVFIKKNGTTFATALDRGAAGMVTQATGIIDMNGTTDYVDAHIETSGTSLNGNPAFSNFSGTMVAPVNGNNAAGWANDGTQSFLLDNADKVGVGTSTPWAKLAVQGDLLQTNPIFEVASSSFTTKFLSVAGSGFGTTTLTGLNITGQATSTSNIGINITGGCFAINGACLSAGGGASFAYPFTAGNSFGATYSTTTTLWFQNGLTASSTSRIANIALDTNGYLNFATTTGSTGYGFRDNGGTMEFKNYGGTWQGVTTATTGPSFRVHRNGSATTTVAGASVVMDWTTEAFDTNNNFNLTNDTFQPTVPGKYIFTASVYCSDSVSYCEIFIKKNGTTFATALDRGAAGMVTQVTGIIDMNGTTDYVDAHVVTSGTSLDGNPAFSNFSGTMVAPVNGNNAAGWANDGTQSFLLDNADKVGVGTSTPWAQLSINPNGITGPAFVIGSSTATNFIVTNEGRVGIGTTSPSQTLALVGNASISQYVFFGPIGFQGSVGYNGFTGNLDITPRAGYDTSITAGNFGIGTTTPTWLLNPSSATAPQLALSAGTGLAQWAFRNAGGNFYLSTTTVAGTATTSTSAITIVGSNGRVGIGSTTPNYVLDVNGDVNVASGSCFRVNGVCIGYTVKLAVIFASSTPSGATTTISFTNAPDAYTFTVAAAPTLTLPRNTSYIVSEVWGGGGGGLTAIAGTGGGGGGYSRKVYVSPLSTKYYNYVGKGGAASAAGTVSTFGTGSATTTANGGGPGAALPGAGGGASGGDVNITGNSGDAVGATGGGTGGSAAGGGGGGGAGANGANNALSGQPFGGGGGGDDNTGAGGGAGGSGGVVISVYATSSPTAAGNDYAEMFPVSSPGINAADIVAVDTGVPVSMKLAQKGDLALAGVISTAPGQVLGDQHATGMRPVALSGRVPVKFSDENGEVKIGDRIAVSSVAGVGMKAGPFDDSVGIVIDAVQIDAEGNRTVLIFLDMHQGVDINTIAFGLLGKDANIFLAPGSATSSATSTSSGTLDFVGGMMNAMSNRLAALAGFSSTSSTATSSNATSTAQDTYAYSLFHTFTSLLTQWFADAGNGIANLFVKEIVAVNVKADSVTTSTLCAKKSDGTEVCVTGDQLAALLASAGTSGGGSGSGSGEGGGEGGGGDITAPVLSFNGAAASSTITIGSTYVDPVTATDETAPANPDVYASVNGATPVLAGTLTLDTSTSTVYIIDYTATDAAGNVGTAERTIEVVPQP